MSTRDDLEGWLLDNVERILNRDWFIAIDDDGSAVSRKEFSEQHIYFLTGEEFFVMILAGLSRTSYKRNIFCDCPEISSFKFPTEVRQLLSRLVLTATRIAANALLKDPCVIPLTRLIQMLMYNHIQSYLSYKYFSNQTFSNSLRECFNSSAEGIIEEYDISPSLVYVEKGEDNQSYTLSHKHLDKVVKLDSKCDVKDYHLCHLAYMIRQNMYDYLSDISGTCDT